MPPLISLPHNSRSHIHCFHHRISLIQQSRRREDSWFLTFALAAGAALAFLAFAGGLKTALRATNTLATITTTITIETLAGSIGTTLATTLYR